MEIELGWGGILNSEEERKNRFSDSQRSDETATLESLLSVCEKYHLPFSFAVVGHLFQSQCDGHKGPHEEGWFELDPRTNVEKDPLFYAPDLVNMIKESSVPHEICTHTFSHIPCDTVNSEVINWELRSVQQVHSEFGVPEPSSIVTPWHRKAPVEVLKANGIDTIRYPGDNYPEEKSRLQKFLWYLFRNPLEREPKEDDGMTKVYCPSGPCLAAYYLPLGGTSPHPAFRIIPKNVRKWIHRTYLRKALKTVRDGSHVHLWCHLYDISNNDQWPLVCSFLHDVGSALKRGEIDVRTLESIST